MACFSGPEIVNDGLVFHYDMNNNVKSWKGKPVENLVASGQRTCSSGLTRMAYHREAYTYVAGISAHGRKDVIKVTCSPTGTDSIAPYADFGFSVSRSGGSQIGDVYWISFDYKNIRGGDNPSIGTVYANGYKQPDAAVVGTFDTPIITDLENGWKRYVRKCTITAAGSSWWRFGQSSGNEEVEFYLDNFQIIHSDVDAPFVDGTRSNTEALLDVSGQGSTITVPGLTYNSDGSFSFDNDLLYSGLYSGRNVATDPITIAAWVKSNVTTGNVMWLDCEGNGTNQRLYSSLITVADSNKFGIQSSTWGNGACAHTNWSYQTIVLDGSTARGYENASEALSKAYTSYTLPGRITFGGRSGYTWNGEIATAQIYNRALSADEIKQNFESTRTKYGV